jgi:hypothetical protein
MEIERLPPGHSLADKHRAAELKWRGKPPGIPPEMAIEFMAKLQAGSTVRKLTGGGKVLGPAFVSYERFKKHCELHPEWATKARGISDINSRIGKGSRKRGKLFEFCTSGRHRMEGDNVMIGRTHKRPGNRFCRACWEEKMTRPMTTEEIASVKRAVTVDGRTINNITTGVPLGGGAKDYSKALIHSSVLRAQYKRDPEFARFVKTAVAGNSARARKIRYTRVHTASVRDDNNDYYRIRDMIASSNPHRDDIVARIFEDLLEGTLKREDVSARVRIYVAELNKLYPIKYAKFGNSPLVSLDEVMFEDGSTTRGDTVSRGLWD